MIVKKTDEILSRKYHKIHNITVTELRFFTVHSLCDSYGHDISHVIFAENMFCLFNNTNVKHWVTYVSDIANSIVRSLNYISMKRKWWQ